MNFPRNLLGLMAVLGILAGGCASETETLNRFSRVNELLVFQATSPDTFELVRRSPELTGKPMNLHFLPDGEVLVGMHPGGLVRFNPETGELGDDFGPGRVYDIEFPRGRVINGIAAEYLTSDYFDEHISLLNKEGLEIGRIPAPRGVHDVDLLENGNLLRLDAYKANKLREVTPQGEIVWESTVPLLNPYEVEVTPRGTYLIANFDRHSMLEIDRENRIVSDIRGFEHPRRFKAIAPDQYIIADSDKRRIVALMPDKQIVPLIEGLNRPLSLAWDPERLLLVVGVEPFFTKDPSIPEEEPYPLARLLTALFWGLTSLLLVAIVVALRRYGALVRNGCSQAAAVTYRVAGPVLLPLAIGLAIASAWCFAHFHYTTGWVLFALATIPALLSAYRRDLWFAEDPPPAEPVEDAEDEDGAATWIQRPWMLYAGFVLCWFSLVWSVQWPADTWLILPWLAGPWLCVYAFRSEARIPFDPVNAIWMVGILLVALFFRTWNIHELPWGLWIDELYAPYRSMVAFESGPIEPFGTTVLIRADEFLMPNLYVLINAYALKYISTSFETVKAMSILPGIGIVIGTYLLAKWAFGAWPARIAGLFAAFNSWLVCFSRWGWLQQWYTLFALLAVAFFIRAWRYRCPRSAALCGLMLGYCFYTYLPVLITAATLFGLFAIGWITPERKLRFKQLLVAAFLVVITFAPQWVYYVNNPGEFLARASSAGVMNEVRRAGSIDPILTSTQKYLLAFHVYGDFNKRHNSPRVLINPATGEPSLNPTTGEPLLNPGQGNPMLDPITGGLMLLGLLLCLVRFYRPAERTLLIVMATAMVGGIMSLAFEAPNTYRLGPVGAICCVLAALPVGLWLMQRERTESDEDSPPRWPLALVLVLIAVMLPINFYRYFALMPNMYAWPESLNAENHTLYTALSPDDIGTNRLFLHFQFGGDVKFGFYSTFLEAQARGTENTQISQNTRYTILDLQQNKPYLSPGTNIIVQPPDYEALVRETYPDADIEVLTSPYGKRIAVVARVEG